MINRQLIDEFIKNISVHDEQDMNIDNPTQATYRNALLQFIRVVGDNVEVTPETFTEFLVALNDRGSSRATKHVYTAAIIKYCDYHDQSNLSEIKKKVKYYIEYVKPSLPDFNPAKVEKIIQYCEGLAGSDNIIDLRDRAFVLTLVDTGLRISEACSLIRKNVDWLEKRVYIKGKEGKIPSIGISERAVSALKDYLEARKNIDPNSKMPIELQPLFAQHGINSQHKINSIKMNGMWQAIKNNRFQPAGVDPKDVRIRDFRRYFVIKAYRGSGNNMKLTKDVARHDSIESTFRYTDIDDESDKKYDDVFNRRLPFNPPEPSSTIEESEMDE